MSGHSTDTGGNPPPAHCALILERTSRRPLHDIAMVLSEHLGIDAPDARSRVRYGGGILAEEIPLQTAEAIAVDLQKAGVASRRVPPTSCWLEPITHKAVQLEILSDTLLVGEVTGASLVFELADVIALNLYGYPPPAPEQPDRFEKRWDRFQSRRPSGADSNIRLAVDGASALAAGAGGLSAATRTMLERMREAELERMSLHLTLYYLENSHPARIRFSKDSADFSPLGARKREHSIENFFILVEDLVDALPAAWNRDAIQAFLEDPDPTCILHLKPEETEKYDRWMLQWVDSERGATPSSPKSLERDA